MARIFLAIESREIRPQLSQSVVDSRDLQENTMRVTKKGRPSIAVSRRHHLKRGDIEFKYYADAIHSGLTPPG